MVGNCSWLDKPVAQKTTQNLKKKNTEKSKILFQETAGDFKAETQRNLKNTKKSKKFTNKYKKVSLENPIAGNCTLGHKAAQATAQNSNTSTFGFPTIFSPRLRFQLFQSIKRPSTEKI